MARNYNRLIRFYDSWFADLSDPTKELTPAECWQVILTIRECQRQLTTQPLQELPLSLRRALSMATLCEQIERIIEKTSSMKDRGSKGGMAAQGYRSMPAVTEEQLKTVHTPPNDGIERNFDGLLQNLQDFGLSDEEQASVIMASNYGQMGDRVWKIIAKCHTVQHKREYLLKAMFNNG